MIIVQCAAVINSINNLRVLNPPSLLGGQLLKVRHGTWKCVKISSLVCLSKVSKLCSSIQEALNSSTGPETHYLWGI